MSPLRNYSNIDIEIGNRYFKYIDEALYYVFDDGKLALLWVPDINLERFSFPDNVVFCDGQMLKNIHADTYDFGNNDWLAEYYSNNIESAEDYVDIDLT